MKMRKVRETMKALVFGCSSFGSELFAIFFPNPANSPLSHHSCIHLNGDHIRAGNGLFLARRAPTPRLLFFSFFSLLALSLLLPGCGGESVEIHESVAYSIASDKEREKLMPFEPLLSQRLPVGLITGGSPFEQVDKVPATLIEVVHGVYYCSIAGLGPWFESAEFCLLFRGNGETPEFLGCGLFLTSDRPTLGGWLIPESGSVTLCFQKIEGSWSVFGKIEGDFFLPESSRGGVEILDAVVFESNFENLVDAIEDEDMIQLLPPWFD